MAAPAVRAPPTDTVPRWRASLRLRRRTLATRLYALAERWVRELEASPGVDFAKLREGLELLKLTKLAERRHNPRHRPIAAPRSPGRTAAARERVIADLRACGVDIARAPSEALADFIESCAPGPDPNRQRSELLLAVHQRVTRCSINFSRDTRRSIDFRDRTRSLLSLSHFPRLPSRSVHPSHDDGLLEYSDGVRHFCQDRGHQGRVRRQQAQGRNRHPLVLVGRHEFRDHWRRVVVAGPARPRSTIFRSCTASTRRRRCC